MTSERYSGKTMSSVIALIIGLVLGTILGMVVAAVLIVGEDYEDRTKR